METRTKSRSAYFLVFVLLLLGIKAPASAQETSEDPFEQRLEYKKAYEAAVKLGNTSKTIAAGEDFAEIERMMIDTIREFVPDDRDTLANAQISLLGVLVYLANEHEGLNQWDKATKLWEEIVPIWEDVERVNEDYKNADVKKRLDRQVVELA